MLINRNIPQSYTAPLRGPGTTDTPTPKAPVTDEQQISSDGFQASTDTIQPRTLRETVSARAAQGQQIGKNFAEKARVPLAIATGTAVAASAGPLGFALAGVIGGIKGGGDIGADVGKDAGVGIADMASGPVMRHYGVAPEKQDEVRGKLGQMGEAGGELVGRVGGSVLGGVTGPLNPIAMGYGAYEVGKNINSSLIDPALAGLGRAGGAAFGVLEHGYNKVVDFFGKSETPAPKPSIHLNGEDWNITG